MIPLTPLMPNHHQSMAIHSKIKWYACLSIIIAFILYGGILLIKTNRYNNKYKNNLHFNKYNSFKDNTALLNRHLFAIISKDAFYSRISFNENYIGTWTQINSSPSLSLAPSELGSAPLPVSISGNAQLLFNLELSNDNKYEFTVRFLIYENRKAFINSFLFSKHNTTHTDPYTQAQTQTQTSTSMTNNHFNYNDDKEEDNGIEHIYQGDIISFINEKRFYSVRMRNCTGILAIRFNSLNDTIKGTLTTINGNCSINLHFEAKIEDKAAKNHNISFYTTMLSLLIICSIISQLSYAIQVEGNMQRSNSLSLFSIALNMIWTVYNIYSNFFLLYINIGYFYQFLLPMILFLFHLGCDMKVWILSIETKYNNTRYISLLTFFALTLSFSSYFLGLGLYFERNYIMVYMALIWYPQIVYNIIYFNDNLFPVSYMIVMTVYRTFIPFYFCAKDINFIGLSEVNIAGVKIYLGIVISSLMVLLSQFAFGSRWFVPIRRYREMSETLYKKRSEMTRLLPSAYSVQCAICLNELFVNQSGLLANDFDCEDGIGIGNDWRRSSNCNKVRAGNRRNKRYRLISFLFCFNKRTQIERRDYMLTKCNHAFHSCCLELWLQFKKDCPNCRREIGK